SVIIRKAFTLYAKNSSRLEDISNFLAQSGIHSRNGKRLHRDRITFILSNPFYYGHFRYGGEIHEGKHQPVVSKKIFDKAQEVLKQRGRPHHKQKNEPQPFCGLLSCASCGMMITGEYKVKRQKNGNVHEYVYYHCTKKSKMKCPEPCIREEELDRQLSSLIQKFSLRQDWAEQLREMLEKEKSESAQSSTAFVQEAGERIRAIQTKLQRLLDGYLEQDIEREIYRTEKAKLLSEKKSLEEQMTRIEQKRTGWLEPAEEWIREAENLPTIANGEDLFLKKVAAKKIFGSNLILSNRKVRLKPEKVPQIQWAALAAANSQIGKMETSRILVREGGIEPPPGAWKAPVLPLNHSRI
ncbi:MAG: Recombinase, partial [Candidatus Giovannonibacteria bacterium GW2011_GWB1_44_23]